MNKTAKKISRRSVLKLLAGGSLSAALGAPTFALIPSDVSAASGACLLASGGMNWKWTGMN